MVIQTYQPDHYSITLAAAQDYEGFYAQEMLFRRMMSYPPGAQMMAVLLSCEEEEHLAVGASYLKQMIERLNRTYKASYRHTNGFDNIDGANYELALWVAYYNFLRPHKHNQYKVLNEVEMLAGADNMPGKWQLLIFLGQQTILNMQKNGMSEMERGCCQ